MKTVKTEKEVVTFFTPYLGIYNAKKNIKGILMQAPFNLSLQMMYRNISTDMWTWGSKPVTSVIECANTMVLPENAGWEVMFFHAHTEMFAWVSTPKTPKRGRPPKRI